MKLHTLSMRDIGPFTGEQSIHFDSLPSLFLISGPTGSGKTSILDAITFALFGNTSGGNDSSDSRIRSHFADPDKPSYVDLVFEVESGIYRAYRSPKWQKPGNKTESNTTGFLAKLAHVDDEEGDVIAEHVRDVTSHCTRLIGMNHAQFCQAVILPQGKFDAFLMMSSKERAAGLEKIFRTGVYSRFTTELRARSGSARQKQQSRAQAICSLATRMADTFVPESGMPEQRGDSPDNSAEAPGVREALEAFQASGQRAQLEPLTAEIEAAYQTHLDTLTTLHEDARRAQDASEQAARALAKAEENARLISEYDQLQARLATLKDQEDEIAARRTQLEAAREAAPLLEDLATLEGHTQALATAEHTLEACEATTEFSVRSPRELRAYARSIDEAFASARDELAALARYREARTQLETAMAAHAAARAEFAARRIKVTDASAVLANCKEALDAAREHHTIYSDAFAEATRLTDLLEASRRATAEENEAQQAERHAQEAYDNAVRRLVAYREQERSYAAWQLATTLVEGEPCPTCGSPSHPAPAHTPADIDPDEGEVLEAEVAQRAKELESARIRVQRAVDARTTLEAEGTPNQWREELATKQTMVERHKGAGVEVARLEAEQRSRERELEALQAQLHEAELAVARSESEAELLQAAFMSAREAIAGQFHGEAIAGNYGEAGGAGSAAPDGEAPDGEVLAERERSLREEAVRLERVRDALGRHQEALEEFARREALAGQAEENVKKNLARSHFTDVAMVRAAAMDAAEMARLEAEISTFSAELHSVRERLTDPRFAALDRELDVSAAARHADEARVAEAVLRDRVSREEERGRIAEGVLKDYRVACEAFLAGAEEAEALTFLANIASGGEGSLTNIPLSSFVLRERFAALLDVANEHLARISHERYQLVHVDDRVGSERQVGLGLLAVDEFADGARREVNSLSGGERFYFSLCLALALSDLIQQENGGIEIGTLLIDEGFGSLSPDRLDEVVEVIRSLADHGQRIGVISHVGELKNMIPARIALQHVQGRSHLELITESE